MKPSTWLFRIVMPALVAAWLVASPARVEGAGKQLYTCGMHPQIIREQPGDCPICGMKLQPVRANAVAAPGAAARTARRPANAKSSSTSPP